MRDEQARRLPTWPGMVQGGLLEEVLPGKETEVRLEERTLHVLVLQEAAL